MSPLVVVDLGVAGCNAVVPVDEVPAFPAVGCVVVPFGEDVALDAVTPLPAAVGE